jgi:hypothetical protein
VARHARADRRRPVTLLYGAAACLVLAQILGIYALRSRKADLIFSLFMLMLLVGSITLGYMGARQQLG